MPNNTTPNEIWMSKKDGGFAVLQVYTVEATAKISNFNRIFTKEDILAPSPVSGDVEAKTLSASGHSLFSNFIKAADHIGLKTIQYSQTLINPALASTNHKPLDWYSGRTLF